MKRSFSRKMVILISFILILTAFVSISLIATANITPEVIIVSLRI